MSDAGMLLVRPNGAAGFTYMLLDPQSGNPRLLPVRRDKNGKDTFPFDLDDLREKHFVEYYETELGVKLDDSTGEDWVNQLRCPFHEDTGKDGKFSIEICSGRWHCHEGGCDSNDGGGHGIYHFEERLHGGEWLSICQRIQQKSGYLVSRLPIEIVESPQSRVGFVQSEEPVPF